MKNDPILKNDRTFPPEAPGGFALGCNYWASHAGMFMWRRWDGAVVERDLDLLSSHGMKLLRVFPLWPDFQPLTGEYVGCGTLRSLLQNGEPLQNEAGVDDAMMERFRFLCDAAEKRGIRIVVGLVTGWMSGRLFAPPAFETREVLTDSEAIVWQCRFVRHFVRAMKDHPAIAAWDLGNECNCMGSADASQMWVWIHAIASEIRAADPTRPVVSGMHSVSTCGRERANMRQQGELVDWLTTHPYPLWTPECNREPFDTLRNECHPACETTFYANLAGRPAFVEEAGSMGPGIVADARAAAAMRAQMFASWAAGVPAFLWWCAFDQGHLDFPPYNRKTVECELGLFTADGAPKPTAEAMRDFGAFLKTLPFGALPPRRVDAVVLVSETEDFWMQALGAWLLSRQAGFDVRYAFAEGDWPDSGFYILPSGGGGYSTFTAGAWKRLLGKARGGATVLVTLGSGCVLAGLEAATGVRTENHFARPSLRRVATPRGAFALADSHTRAVTAAPDCEILARDENGEPVMTSRRLGAGRVLFVNGALETAAPIAGWPLYAAAAEAAGVKRLVRGDDPAVGFTEHPAPDGRTWVVAVNYAPRPAVCRIQTAARISRVFGGATLEDDLLRLPANDGAVMELWSHPR